MVYDDGCRIHYTYDAAGNLLQTQQTANTARWDAVAESDLAHNPRGPWAHALQFPQQVPVTMTGTSVNCGDLGLPCWKTNPTAFDLPFVAINNPGATVTRRTVVIPSAMMSLHPGAAGERALVMFTAPRPVPMR